MIICSSLAGLHRACQIILRVDRSAFTAEMHAILPLSFDAVFCNVPLREVTASDPTTAA